MTQPRCNTPVATRTAMPSIVSACRFQHMHPGAKVRCPSDPSWRIIEFAFFGSVLRDDFDAASDLDILVAFAPNADWSLLDHVQMEQELEALLGRKVDLLSRRSVERSHNWLRRRENSTQKDRQSFAGDASPGIDGPTRANDPWPEAATRTAGPVPDSPRTSRTRGVARRSRAARQAWAICTFA